MLHHLTGPRALLLLLGLTATLVAFLFPTWKENSDKGGQNIAGNLHYVGASLVTSFVLTGPGGYILIDGGDSRHAALSGDALHTHRAADHDRLINVEPDGNLVVAPGPFPSAD